MKLLSSKKYLGVLFGILFPFYLFFTFNHSLWNPDETRDGGIARSMYVDKDFVVPRLNGEAFLEKPPLYYWSCSAVYAITRTITAGTTRLPAALYGFLGLLFTFLIGRTLFNARVGFVAACILGTSFQYFRMSHMALMDSALTALMAGAFFFYVQKRDFLFVLFAVLAFYTKGFVALALMGIVIAWDLGWQKDLKRLLRITCMGLIVFLALVFPWVYGLWKSGGREYLEVFFIHNNFHRFTSAKADHTENPFYLYFLSFPADFLPWSLFLLPLALLQKDKRNFVSSPAERFPFRWFFCIFIFLTISSSKRSMYLLPAMPAAALMTALFIEKQIQNGPSRAWIWTTFKSTFITLLIAVVALDVFAVPRMEEEKTFVPFARAVQQEIKKRNMSVENIVGYDFNEMERGVFSFYLESNFKAIPKPAENLRQQLTELTSQPHLLMINKNAKADVADILDRHFLYVLDYRPGESKRSYILYETKNKEGRYER